MIDKLGGKDCYLEGPGQAGETSWQESHEIQQKQSCTCDRTTPCNSNRLGLPAWKTALQNRIQGPGRQQDDHEAAIRALATQKHKPLLGCIMSEARKAVILPLSSALERLHLKFLPSFGFTRTKNLGYSSKSRRRPPR